MQRSVGCFARNHGNDIELHDIQLQTSDELHTLYRKQDIY